MWLANVLLSTTVMFLLCTITFKVEWSDETYFFRNQSTFLHLIARIQLRDTAALAKILGQHGQNNQHLLPSFLWTPTFRQPLRRTPLTNYVNIMASLALSHGHHEMSIARTVLESLAKLL